MKILSWTAVALSFGSVSAFASVDFALFHTMQPQESATSIAATGSQEPSRFEQLKHDFQRGTLPTQAELTGWYSGRCFNGSNSDTPFGMVMVGEEVVTTTTPDGGPLFPPVQSRTFNLVIVNHGGADPSTAAPDRYDNLTDSDKSDIAAYTQGDEARGFVSQPKDGEYQTVNDAGDLIYHFRKFADYIVEKNTLIRDDSGINLHAGDTWVMCYFFKKVN